MSRVRHTKILATLGPATRGAAAIARLVAAGANALRLNFSHGSAAEHEAAVADIRAVEAATGTPLAVLADLQGPKIRCGPLADPAGVQLATGQRFCLTRDDAPGDAERVGVTLEAIIDEVPVGGRLLLRDGLIELRVEERRADALVCRVINAGRLTGGAGINVPETELSIPALSAKDAEDLALATRLGVDWIGLSFVRRPSDVHAARAAMARLGTSARLLAKIEKPSAVRDFEAILELADGIMIARGDLGVELAPEAVPVVQRRLVRLTEAAGKPVVVATQMLESMIGNPRPTRAEASDVATAIYELADVVMLSGETAVGQYPAEAVAVMASIAATVEASEDYGPSLYRYYDLAEPQTDAAIAHTACRLAQILPAAAVATYTITGATARGVARYRPASPILALTPSLATARALALSWGVNALVVADSHDHERLVDDARARLVDLGWAAAGAALVITSGVPLSEPGRTNLLRVARV